MTDQRFRSDTLTDQERGILRRQAMEEEGRRRDVEAEARRTARDRRGGDSRGLTKAEAKAERAVRDFRYSEPMERLRVHVDAGRSIGASQRLALGHYETSKARLTPEQLEAARQAAAERRP